MLPVVGDLLDLPTPAPARLRWRKTACQRRDALSQSESVEPDIVLDHCVQSDWHASRIRQIKLPKHDLVAPDLSQKILKYENCQSFTRTSSVSKAERSKAGIITNWVASFVRNDK